jgi:hypothetical protein
MNRFTDLALDKNALDFQDLFQEVLSQKVSDALDAKKVEIAATMFEDSAIAEEKIEMTRGGRATGNAIADIVAKNNARLAKKKADRAKHLRKKEKYDGGVKEEVEQIDELGDTWLGRAKLDAAHAKRKSQTSDMKKVEPKEFNTNLTMWTHGPKTTNLHNKANKIGKYIEKNKEKNAEKKIKLSPATKRVINKEEVELDEGMVDHIARIHVHGSNVTLHMDNGKKSTQRHPSPEAALKDGRAYHKATGREAKLVIAK